MHAYSPKGWSFEQWECCMYGADYPKPTHLLCSPGWRPALTRRCTKDPTTGLFSCGHTEKGGRNPHVPLGTAGGTTMGKAAQYVDGLVEEWALEVVRLQESLNSVSPPSSMAVEAAPRIVRHVTRGCDPESTREQRDRENWECRAGLRNPRFIAREHPELPKTMRGIADVLRQARQKNPAFQNLQGACGETPARPPPTDAEVQELRATIYSYLGISSQQGKARHPRTEWRAGLVEKVQELTGDPDTAVASWLRWGAPAGFSKQVPAGPWFPRVEGAAAYSEAELLSATVNHPSFYEAHGERVAPGKRLALAAAQAGFGVLYPDRQAAERAVGQTHPAPLGNLRKPRAGGGGFKDRLILDLKWTRSNGLVIIRERAVLPRGLDHALDLAQLRAKRRRVKTLVLDLVDAFHWIPLHPDEVRFCAADLDEDGFIVFTGMGFGGRAFPLVFARVVSVVSRTTQALFDEDCARLQFFVDDPALSAAGDDEETTEIFDLAIMWWLVLGARLSWVKGAVSEGVHRWIGIEYSFTEAGDAVMEIPADYAAKVLADLEPLARSSGSVALSDARRAVGRAQRVAQVVPEAQPFASGLWGALADAVRVAESGHREARPGQVPCVRFATAAQWFVALLTGLVLPLRRVVTAKEHEPQVAGPISLAFDASPLGWGGTVSLGGLPLRWAAAPWDTPTLQRFKAKTGDPAFQALWEHLAQLLVLIMWAPPDEPFSIHGGNLGALQNPNRLRGKKMLLAVAREAAWRRAALRWRIIPAHRPAELNVVCDALSRLYAPTAAELPRTLVGVTRETPPEVESIWKAWTPPPAKETAKMRRTRWVLGKKGHKRCCRGGSNK